MVTRSLLFVAGTSGSGKSRLARTAHAASVSLDEFEPMAMRSALKVVQRAAR